MVSEPLHGSGWTAGRLVETPVSHELTLIRWAFRNRPRTYCLAYSDEESSSAGSSDEEDSSELSNDSAGAEGFVQTCTDCPFKRLSEAFLI